MHVTLVHVHVKPEHVAEFIAATGANHDGSVGEPGNVRFDVLQLTEDPSRFALYEVFATAEDAAAHKQAPHYLAWKDKVRDWMASPRHGVPYRALFPDEPGKW